ncbi:uncharacterized protein LOC105836987 isoform X2 [Monomorium pharaonis]|nr:uncharacterized protein LOC105836987 isoform X2 [Monomorium pharaonis]XP_036138584.1 uncharacterized protein LOC105836987 isoform X2 [Monomorium pharaonis]XP_036138585.1 uncharacterized protein LOC105836987 isoform X2 [Monomorium pharaonis]
MEPVEFVAVKEENSNDDLENNYSPFDPFEMEERKQELTDALKYCIDLLKDAQVISDLATEQNSHRTISMRSQLMGKEIQRRIMDMLFSMKFIEDEEDVKVVEEPISNSLENSCDLNERDSRNDSTKSAEKDMSISNQSLKCVDEDQFNGLYENSKNSPKTENIKNKTLNKMRRQQLTSNKKERKTWDAELMQQAIDCVRTKKLGYTKAANLFEVPRSTLRRLVATDLSSEECVNIKIGRKPIMPPEMEAQLVNYLLMMKNRFFALTSNDVRRMAYQIAAKNELNCFGQNNEAGRVWFDRFIRRHSNLDIFKPSIHHTSESIVNKESMLEFYKMLENMYKEHNYDADRIFNVDEASFYIVHKKTPHVICLKRKKQVDSLTSAERRSLVTVICSMSAGGTFIPPMLIFPCKNMTDILMKGAPASFIGRCHPSGKVQTHLFVEWFEHFIKKTNPTKESPVLLILNGQYTYIRHLNVIDMAYKNYVTILSVPPYALLYKMQPLDCTFMGPLKQYYNEYVRIWHCETKRSVEQHNIAEILGKAYLQCQTGLIAANGFKVTGIYPFNSHVDLHRDFITTTSIEEEFLK